MRGEGRERSVSDRSGGFCFITTVATTKIKHCFNLDSLVVATSIYNALSCLLCS